MKTTIESGAAIKYLSDYTKEGISELYDRLGAFFAFSTKQFKESAVKGEKYMSLGSGTVVPQRNAAALVDGVAEVIAKGIEADKGDHTPEQIILRELRNHECFYVGSPCAAIDKLKDYGDGFGESEVRKVFAKAWDKETEDL